MPEPDCWYVYFDLMVKESEWTPIANAIAKRYPPGCYMVSHSFYNPPRIESMGGGKTGAHQKRRAALKVPDAEWVKRSIFIVAGGERP